MKLTDKQLNKHFGHREEHEYRHFNRSLGCFVEGKEHFKKLMAQRKMVPYDLAEQYAEGYDKRHPRQAYELSPKAQDIIRSVKLTADRKGNIKLGGRAIKALQEIGAIPSDTVQQQMNDIYREETLGKGGFLQKDQGSFKVQQKT